MKDRFELYIKPDYNFIHWLRNEKNNYKGYKFWKYFAIKKTKINENGITIDFIEFSEQGKPHIAYHYFDKSFSLASIWNFEIYDNLQQAWRYLEVPQFYNSFNEALEVILKMYEQKVKYTCGQFMS